MFPLDKALSPILPEVTEPETRDPVPPPTPDAK
jgi:hypothetical protein